MKIIIIESTVYKVSEKIYSQIRNKKEEMDKKGYYNGCDVDMSGFLESLMPEFKKIGAVDYDFRL